MDTNIVIDDIMRVSVGGLTYVIYLSYKEDKARILDPATGKVIFYYAPLKGKDKPKLQGEFRKVVRWVVRQAKDREKMESQGFAFADKRAMEIVPMPKDVLEKFASAPPLPGRLYQPSPTKKKGKS